MDICESQSGTTELYHYNFDGTIYTGSVFDNAKPSHTEPISGGQGVVRSPKAKRMRNAADPIVQKLSREERRRRRRCTEKYRHAHATRERARIEAFNLGFGALRKLLPVMPPDKKLSKIEILRLAICYIAYLNHMLGSY